jgi:hypothetical protein
MIINAKIEGIWKEKVVVYFKVQQFPRTRNRLTLLPRSCVQHFSFCFVLSALVAVEESQLLLTTSFLGNSGQVVQYISTVLWPLWKQVHKMCSSKTTAQVKIFTFCSCLGLLPTNGSNNVNNYSCFNCCILNSCLERVSLYRRNVSV